MLLSFLLALQRPDGRTMAANKRTIEDEGIYAESTFIDGQVEPGHPS